MKQTKAKHKTHIHTHTQEWDKSNKINLMLNPTLDFKNL